MIKKEECIPGKLVTVNNKKLEMGCFTKQNGLTCWEKYGHSPILSGGCKEIIPGAELEILSPPKQKGSCKLVRFKHIETGKELCAFWIEFKFKVDLIK